MQLFCLIHSRVYECRSLHRLSKSECDHLTSVLLNLWELHRLGPLVFKQCNRITCIINRPLIWYILCHDLSLHCWYEQIEHQRHGVNTDRQSFSISATTEKPLKKKEHSRSCLLLACGLTCLVAVVWRLTMIFTVYRQGGGSFLCLLGNWSVRHKSI